jgi:hypothetical protein
MFEVSLDCSKQPRQLIRERYWYVDYRTKGIIIVGLPVIFNCLVYHSLCATFILCAQGTVFMVRSLITYYDL